MGGLRIKMPSIDFEINEILELARPERRRLYFYFPISRRF